MKATDVRKHWSQFNDDVVHAGPRFVQRNRDEWVALNTDHLEVILEPFTFNAETFLEDDGSVTVSLREFDLVENGETEETALDLLTDELLEYAEDYMDNFNMYFNSPNRQSHFPYIMNILSQDNKESLRSLIRCQPGKR
ncbi:hypothetical protein [Salinicoccus halitifaciens]|uniref:Antitoxin of toxin-antitoxin, RelE / RelB, TA system n=1 Tax=Salinicoccus halitifaciens TaxID=1073415 RepID=A0ABV2ECE2_9STAP|nr:hypothetical protein [Salinicoccus halitifaciens]MCD2138742.1 hypothetical protein [Salinicoccus halitifaciens]